MMKGLALHLARHVDNAKRSTDEGHGARREGRKKETDGPTESERSETGEQLRVLLAFHPLDETMGKDETGDDEKYRNHGSARINDPDERQQPERRVVLVPPSRVDGRVRDVGPVEDENNEGRDTANTVKIFGRMWFSQGSVRLLW